MPAIPLPDPPLSDGAVWLRQWERGDVDALVAACQDPEIGRWTAVPDAYTSADARIFVARAEPDRVAGGLLALAVLAADTDELLGSCGLVRVDWESRRAEIGYWVAAHARRRGVGTRAVRLLARWALEELGLNRLELLANPDNVASQRLAVRAGFRHEGLLRDYRVRKGELESYVAFSLLPSDLGAGVGLRPERDQRARAGRAIRVRPAAAGDALAIARVHVSSWHAAYRGAVPDELLDALSVEERAERWRRLLGEGPRAPTLVAELGGRVVGFCSLATPAYGAGGERAAPRAGARGAPVAGARDAELTALYVEPRRCGGGVGARLLRAALEALEAGGWREVTLTVLPENEPARGFYARFGFVADAGWERDERTGLPTIRMRRALRPGG